MRKILSYEDKQALAELYEDKRPVGEIARKFGITPGSVYKYASEMGAHRGQQAPKRQDKAIEEPKPKADESETDESKSALKKPWYLKKQVPIN